MHDKLVKDKVLPKKNSHSTNNELTIGDHVELPVVAVMYTC